MATTGFGCSVGSEVSGDPESPSRADGGQPAVSTADLCDALADAPQVWVLDIRLSSDQEVQLYIEDGEVFDENLDKAVTIRSIGG